MVDTVGVSVELSIGVGLEVGVFPFVVEGSTVEGSTVEGSTVCAVELLPEK